MIYWIVFLLSTLFIKIGESGKKYKAFCLLGIFFPVVLASIRSDMVGIDISTYVRPMFEHICESKGLINYFQLMKADLFTCDLEYGFSIVGYIFGKLFGSIIGVHFIYELIIMTNLFAAVKLFNRYMTMYYGRNDKNIPIYIAFFLYYMFFYNMSLTMVRQSVAVSLVLLSVICWINSMRKTSIILIISAVLMHSTALFGVILILLWIGIQKKMKLIIRIYWLCLIVFGIFSKNLYFLILNILSKFFAISLRYLSKGYMDFTGSDVNLAWLYLVIITVLGTYIIYKRSKNDMFKKYLFLLCITQVFLFPLSVISANAGRILYYMMIFSVLVIPFSYRSVVKKDSTNQLYVKFGIMLIGIIYWLGTVGFNDITGTLVYTFGI